MKGTIQCFTVNYGECVKSPVFLEAFINQCHDTGVKGRWYYELFSASKSI